jgi:hypothetical protein
VREGLPCAGRQGTPDPLRGPILVVWHLTTVAALVYGVPAPWQVTVLPSPGCQVTDTGVAVAVTLSPGTIAVFDSAGLIHSQVGPGHLPILT